MAPEAPEKNNNQPHIVLFSDMDEDDNNDHLAEQHFISVEQDLMMETSTIMAVIFFCISAHYLFNLSYHPKTGDVWVFMQEKILGVLSKTGVKRHPSTLSHFSGITSHCLTLNTKTVDAYHSGRYLFGTCTYKYAL